MSTITDLDIDLEPPDAPALDRPGRPDDTTYEVINGQRLEMPPMSVVAAKVASRLTGHLFGFASGRRLGEAVAEALFRFPLAEDEHRNRRPDVAFVSFDRWPLDREQPHETNAWDVVPDLAVEVVSPSDLAEDQLDKVLEYLRAGVRLVWVVYPKQMQTHIYE